MDLGQIDIGQLEGVRLLGVVALAFAIWLRRKAAANWKVWQKAIGPIKPSLDPSASPMATTFDGATGCSLSMMLNILALVALGVGVDLLLLGGQVTAWVLGIN